MIYRDRRHAGKKLAEKLQKYRNDPRTVVLGLPRGGVVVADEIAQGISAPLDIIIVQKIRSPFNPEYAIGATGEDGTVLWGDRPERKALLAAQAEVRRRRRRYRRQELILSGKTAVIVDDGVATGLTVSAAVQVAKNMKAQKVIVAVPHGDPESLRNIEGSVDELIVLERPVWYGSVGSFYESFPQVNDAEVLEILNKYRTNKPQ